MNIVIVCDILGKKNNGTSIASYNLINYLKSKGHSIKVVCCDLDENENADEFIVLNKLNLGPLNKIVERNGVSLPLSDKKVITNAIKGCDIVHCLSYGEKTRQACDGWVPLPSRTYLKSPRAYECRCGQHSHLQEVL